MLERKHRIASRERISEIMKSGRVRKAPFFLIKVLPNNVGVSRFAVIASKKVSPLATVRNRARRRMYEAVRLSLPSMKNSCYDVVVLVSARVLNAPIEQLQAALHSTIK